MGYIKGMKKPITTRISDFEQLIYTNNIYVDKTSYIYDMVKQKGADYYFISRPRRYGKSLFCSTLEYLFRGRRDLFKGLYITEHTDYSFEEYPVLHLNFAKLRTQTFEQFYKSFQEMVATKIRDNGSFVSEEDPPSIMLDKYLLQSPKNVVIIIDEFDAPIIDSITDKEKANKIRDEFASFYTVIKNTGEKVRFFFLTGVTKLSNMSIFSKMNNLNDISMNPEYATAFGYTEEELEENFAEYIEEYLTSEDCPYENRKELITDIRDYYDGYRFSFRSDEKVYNPVSVGKFFSNGCSFENYWESTGVSSLAVEMAKRYDLISLVEEKPDVGIEAFTSFDISLLTEKTLRLSSIYALLYYTGYLTIAEGDAMGLTLAFPNREISSSFSASLVTRYMEKGAELGSIAYSMSRTLERGEIREFITKLQQYYEAFPYDLLYKDKEKTYQILFHALFVASGSDVYVEDHGLRGRADNVIRKKSHVYICELKVDGKAENAIKQIRERKYYAKYLPLAERGIKIHLLGISFSSEKRMIEDYKEELI